VPTLELMFCGANTVTYSAIQSGAWECDTDSMQRSTKAPQAIKNLRNSNERLTLCCSLGSPLQEHRISVHLHGLLPEQTPS
jgi:hypothetical protein